MFKLVVASSLVLGSMALPVSAAFAQEFNITAPAAMDQDQMRDWARLERQGNRLLERIASDEGRVADEISEVAMAQAKLAAAQAKVQEEQRELERAQSRLADRQTELANVESRMMSMGGERPAVALTTP